MLSTNYSMVKLRYEQYGRSIIMELKHINKNLYTEFSLLVNLHPYTTP